MLAKAIDLPRQHHARSHQSGMKEVKEKRITMHLLNLADVAVPVSEGVATTGPTSRARIRSASSIRRTIAPSPARLLSDQQVDTCTPGGAGSGLRRYKLGSRERLH
jgi:hypothetical protein